MRYRRRDWQDEMIKDNTNKLVFFNFKNIKKYLNKFENISLEIGVGKGDFIVNKALRDKKTLYIGIERISSVLAMCLKKMKQESIENIILLNIDANLLKEEELFNNKIDKIYLNFSDPWPKKRHAKRRLTSPLFLDVYEKILKKEGKLVFKTDNLNLFKYSLETIENSSFIIEKKDFNYIVNENKDDVETEYEKKFKEKGFKINRLIAINSK